MTTDPGATSRFVPAAIIQSRSLSFKMPSSSSAFLTNLSPLWKDFHHFFARRVKPRSANLSILNLNEGRTWSHVPLLVLFHRVCGDIFDGDRLTAPRGFADMHQFH